MCTSDALTAAPQPKGSDKPVTDKPDVAALTMTHLLSWLPEGYTHCKHGTREWCESYLNNARDVIEAQAVELTRLAARAKNEREKGFGEGRSECLAAKAEIARLTDYNARLHADIAEIGKDNDNLEAEIARLQGWLEERDAFIVHNDLWAKFVGQFPLAALKPDTGEQS